MLGALAVIPGHAGLRGEIPRALRRARERALEARFAAALDERTRLAREIHDTLLQGFTGIALSLLAASGSPEIAAALKHLVRLSQKTLKDARQAIWDMRSPSLSGVRLTRSSARPSRRVFLRRPGRRASRG